MKALAMALAASMITATGALAQEPAAAQVAQPERKICKTHKMTGSLTRVRRVCLTQSQWAQMAQNTRRSVDSLEDDANQKESICLRDGSQNC